VTVVNPLRIGRLSHSSRSPSITRNIRGWINNADGISFHLRVSVNEVPGNKFCQSFSSSNPIAGLSPGKTLRENGLFTRIKTDLPHLHCTPIVRYVRFGVYTSIFNLKFYADFTLKKIRRRISIVEKNLFAIKL
jgi:hypothetical protein